MVFFVVAVASLATAWIAYVSVQEAARLKFQSTADDALNRIEGSLELNLSLLTSSRAFFRTRGSDMSRVQFQQFFQALDVERNFGGLRGIGYLRLVRTGQEENIEREIVKAQGMERGIYPDTDQAWRAPIILFEPLTDDNISGIGYDMFSDPVRRSAIEIAVRTGRRQATARILLGQATGSDEVHPGFLAFVPLADTTPDLNTIDPTEEPIGVLYASFRSENLFGIALGKPPLLPINVQIYDGEPGADTLLFRSANRPDEFMSSMLSIERDIEVAGRTWHLIFRPTAAFTMPASTLTPILIGIGGLLLAFAIAMIVRLQHRAVETEAALRQTTEKALTERELILQEMKHRIKNSIARMLAIARQTGANSRSIEEFTASFSARLQAMAASQDMLTRSQWQKADLGRLLRTELEQVFGQNIEKVRLSGPSVELDENVTQALGLTFHELATNALKYGEAGSEKGALSVEWSTKRHAGKRRLALTWTETTQAPIAKPSRTGFGTKLIDMNITRELGGTIVRDFGYDGLVIEIEVPLHE